MKVVEDFKEYQILDMAHKEKLEVWNDITLIRPDPQILWNEETYPPLWKQYDAKYTRSKEGGGEWNVVTKIPTSWNVTYQDMIFGLKLMGFKHTGLFPEQAYNWNFLREKIKNANRPIKVLNLFAYTGASSIACLKEHASVTHVDASKGMIEWAKENVKLNHLENESIRFLVDDVVKFVKREIRRGNKYDIIIMDPPSFGRGSKKEVWSFEDDIYSLVKDCTELLSKEPLLFLINSYSTGISKTVLEDILKMTVGKKFLGEVSSDELGILMQDKSLILPCGIYARWEK